MKIIICPLFVFTIYTFFSPSYAVLNLSGVLFINGTPIASTDEHFICATMDWWPPQKQDFGIHGWLNSSLLDQIDLKSTSLINAVKAFSTLKIRMGGTLQDILLYQMKEDEPCPSFSTNPKLPFGFSKGCLSIKRWKEITSFLEEGGAWGYFGLNALEGRTLMANGIAAGAWNFTNSEFFINNLTVSPNIHGFELGNELIGNSIGARVPVSQYAEDTKALASIMKKKQKNKKGFLPFVMGPGALFLPAQFEEFINLTNTTLDVFTIHIYDLGSGVDSNLTGRILDPEVLNRAGGKLREVKKMIKAARSKAVLWIGECGGAYQSGQNGTTNTFTMSLWYADQLGMTSVNGVKTFCRQTLLGGNYGLIDAQTLQPNPDYFSALLWSKLMGRKVIQAKFVSIPESNKIRSYVHCAKKSKGITVLLINLHKNTTVSVKIVGGGVKEEYHLSAPGGNLHSRIVLLNQKELNRDFSRGLPTLSPQINVNNFTSVHPLSIVFIKILDFDVPACRRY